MSTLSAYFVDVVQAAQCASAIVSSGVQPMILELMDGKTLQAIDGDTGTTHRDHGGAMLLVQTHGYGAALEMDVITSVVEGFSSSMAVTTNPVESEVLVEARRHAIHAIGRHGVAYVGDVGVPRKHLGAMAAEIHRIGEETRVDLYTVAHAGDGNLHPILALRPGELIDRGAPKEAMNQIFWAANALGGTLSGEHGQLLREGLKYVEELPSFIKADESFLVEDLLEWSEGRHTTAKELLSAFVEAASHR